MYSFKACLQPILDEAPRRRHFRCSGQHFARELVEYVLVPLEGLLSLLGTFGYGVRPLSTLDDLDVLPALRNALGPSNTSLRTLRIYTEDDATLITLENLSHIPGRFPFTTIRHLKLFNAIHGCFQHSCSTLITPRFDIPPLTVKRCWTDLSALEEPFPPKYPPENLVSSPAEEFGDRGHTPVHNRVGLLL